MEGKNQLGTRLCRACSHFGLEPAAPAVDLFEVSHDEADGLCQAHRSKMTEGYCVLCGRRSPWLTLDDESDTGACRPCFAGRFGEATAQQVEAYWAELDSAQNV